MKQEKLFKELKMVSIIYIVLYLLIFGLNMVLYSHFNLFSLISIIVFSILLLTLIKKMAIAPKISIVIGAVFLILTVMQIDIIGIIISAAILYDSILLLKAVKNNE